MKFALIFGDTGKGHYVPAKAIADALEEMGHEAEVTEVFTSLGAGHLRESAKNQWKLSLHFPLAERISSSMVDTPLAFEPLLSTIEKRYNEQFMEWYKTTRPDAILGTQYLCSRIMDRFVEKNGLDIPVMAYAPDIFFAQMTSYSPHYARYFISSLEGRELIIQDGIQSPDSVELVPFPLQTSFRTFKKVSREESCRRLGINPDLFTIFLSLGGEGIGRVSILERLAASRLPVQVLILGNPVGMSARHIARFRHRHPEFSLITPGYVSNAQEYTNASHLVMGKAGTNTMMEALYLGKPCMMTELFSSAVKAADYLQENQIGWYAPTGRRQMRIITDLIREPHRMEELKARISTLPLAYDTMAFARRIIEVCSMYRNL